MNQEPRNSGAFLWEDGMAYPSTERIKELLNYDSESGLFTWIANRKGRFGRAGVEAGRKNKSGYIVIGIDGGTFAAHRLAWLCVHGDLPKGMTIDHINRVKSDNRIINLRVCKLSDNSFNKPVYKNNKCGMKGVYFDDSRRGNKKWRARIYINKKRISLGAFLTKEEAFEKYKQASVKYHKEYSIYQSQKNYSL